jgi:hypothetical protein
MITFLNYTTFFIIGLMLFFYIFICYLVLFDTSNYIIINNNRVLIKQFIILIIYLVFLGYLFVLRFRRINLKLYYKEVFENLSNMYFSLYEDKLLFLLYILLFGFVFIIILKCFHTYIKKVVLSLYLYYYQYNTFSSFLTAFVSKVSSIGTYLIIKTLKKTKNLTKEKKAFFVFLAQAIWPNSLLLLEKLIFACLLPYLLFFDFLVEEYIITRIFYVLPWYFLYSLWRTLLLSLFEVKNLNYVAITMKHYGLGK